MEELLSDREVLERFGDLMKMQGHCLVPSQLPAPIKVNVKMVPVSLLLWFAKPRLVIYMFPSIGVSVLPSSWWLVWCFGGGEVLGETGLLAKDPGFGRTSPFVTTVSPIGMRVFNHCTSSLICCPG